MLRAKNTFCSLCFWLCWMCVTVGFTEEREAFYILARQIFRKVIFWMKAGYLLGGQSQLQCCAKCSSAPTNSLRIVRKAQPSFQKAKYLKTRPSWPQWCTYCGYSETKLLLSGSRTTRSLGPTPKSCDVTTWTRVVYIYTLVYIYRYIYGNIDIYVYTNTSTNIYTHIYIRIQTQMYVCTYIYMYVYIHIHMYIYTFLYTYV